MNALILSQFMLNHVTPRNNNSNFQIPLTFLEATI